MFPTFLFAVLSGCTTTPTPSAPPVVAPKPAPQPAADRGPDTPLPGLLLAQARFMKVGGKMTPRPATLWLLRQQGEKWHEEVLEDDTSNVFHKAIWWRDGILTIGAMKAKLTHWKRVGTSWKPHVLWEQSFGGKFDRLRDIEIGDVTGDGKENLVIATHDQGVVAIGTERDDEGWDFQEFDKTPDTFVHEIELGRVSGKSLQIFSTPSDRNRSSGASQPGGVNVYTFADGTFTSKPVVHWEESHAKEILTADVDGDGRDELYAVREAHVVLEGKKKKREGNVRIVRLTPTGDTWTETLVAELDDDMCRFLTAADVDHDGKLELIAGGHTSGLWMMEEADGTYASSSIAKDSAGFEHALHTADLDGDGKTELYVASDDQNEVRRYVFKDGHWTSSVIARMPPRTITWNVQDGRF